MKKTLLSIALISSLGVFAQTGYYTLSPVTGENPGRLSTDAEWPLDGGLPTGWTTITATSNATPTWSAAQNLPAGFNFSFNGSAVTQFKVSTSGVLTFDVASTVAAPATENVALPSPLIPNKSVCVWGLVPTSRAFAAPFENYILSKTFGTGSKRQHWISFNLFGEPNIQSGWTFWSIVLEEGTNRIYIVDQKTVCITAAQQTCTSKTSLTAGVQIDTSTALQVAGSPTLQNVAGTLPDPTDNVYYEFAPGTQPALDARITQNATSDLVSLNSPSLAIKVNVRNAGSQGITKGKINYSINGAAAVTAPFTNAIGANGGVTLLTHTTPFVPVTADAGANKNIVVWLSDINDGSEASDSITFTTFVNAGVSGTKRVLIEEGSGAWCGFCPDGHVILRDLIHDNNKIVGVVHHNNANGNPANDMMTNAQSDIINSTWATGYPYGMVDRYKFENSENVGLDRNDWAAAAADRLNAVTPVNVSITNKVYNPTTRTVTYSVKADFVDYALPGDLRINTFIVEDDVRGPKGNSLTNTNYNQHSYFSSEYQSGGDPNSELYNEPEYFYGYRHQHVVMNIPSTAWGTASIIPNNPAQGSSYTKSYTYTLPAVVKVTADDYKNIGNLQSIYQSTKPGDARNKDYASKIVAFVSYYNDNTDKREILNVIEAPLAFAVGINETSDDASIANVYPNPAVGLTGVDFTMKSNSNVTVEIVNIVGQKVMTVKNGAYAAGNHTVFFNAGDLKNGIYFVNIKTTEGSATKRFVVAN